MATILSPFQLLEVNVISAQDLAQVSRKMRTYAVAWVHPDRKLSTRVATEGRNNPTWNDKFVFRVDDDFLHGDTSAVMIEIYAVHWFRDIHVGTVRVIVGNLIPPPRPPRHNQFQLGMRFVALQVRRPSGRPQGILNIGVALLDSSMRSMPLYSQISASAVGYRHLMGEEDPAHHKDDYDGKKIDILPSWIPKPELRRTKSDSSSIFGSTVMAQKKTKPKGKGGSLISGPELDQEKNKKKINKGRSKASSMISGSELEKKKKKRKPKGGSLISDSEIVKKEQNDDKILVFSDSEVNWAFVKPSLSYESPANEAKLTELENVKTPFPKLNSGHATPKKENLTSRPVITESELGPSPSEVAAVVARNGHYHVHEMESEVIGEMSLDGSMEGLQSKLARWRTELPPIYDVSDQLSSFPKSITTKDAKIKKTNVHNHRHTADENTFTCFGRICGLECTIVCGGSSPPRRRKTGKAKRSYSMDNLRYHQI